MLIGLAAKNAILIVEFAKRRREEGLEIVEAAMEAGRLRLRPILMTAFAFILGVLPLVFATGAGAASRQSIGTTVFGGMLAATVLTLIFVPVFYAVIEQCAGARTCQSAGGGRRLDEISAAGRAPGGRMNLEIAAMRIWKVVLGIGAVAAAAAAWHALDRSGGNIGAARPRRLARHDG